MSVVWELSKAGDRRPLRGWGITSAVLTRRSFGRDELTLVAGGVSVSAAAIFGWRERLTLWRDGVRYFSGEQIAPEAVGSAASESHTYVVAGPWWGLENLVYQEERYMFTEPDDPDSGKVRVFSSRAVLFADLTGAARNTASQAGEAIGYAAGRGVPIQSGGLGVNMTVPWEEAADITVAEVIKRCCRWAPQAVCWFSYATATPALNLTPRGSLTAVTLDLDDANLVREFSVAPLYAERPPGVRFFFEDVKVMPDGNTRARYVSQSAGNPDAVGAVVAVIELGGQGSENPEPVPDGLAGAFYGAVSTLNYGGRIVTQAADVAGELRPGRKLNLTNGRAEWATMGATIQASSEDLLRGVTTAEFGASPWLGAAQFADYLRFQRLREKSSYMESRITGGGNTSAVSPSNILYAGGDFGYSEIELCDGSGQPPRKIKVFSEVLEPGGA